MASERRRVIDFLQPEKVQLRTEENAMEITIVGTQGGVSLAPPCPPLLAKVPVTAHDLGDEDARVIYLFAPDKTAIGTGALEWSESLQAHTGFLTTWTEEASAYVDAAATLRPRASLQVAKYNEDESLTPDIIMPVRCLVSNVLSTPPPTPSQTYLTQSMFADLQARLDAASTLGNTKSIINEILNILTGTTP